MKNKLLFIVLLLTLCLGLLGCGETYDSLSEEHATIENPTDPTKKVTIEDYSGVFSVKLDNTYVGSDAVSFLTSIGEASEQFGSDSLIDAGDKLIVHEYTVSADQGYEDEPFSFANVISNDMWDANHQSKYEYAIFDLYENASLDYYQLELNSGESSKMYMVFELPANVDKYVSSISGVNRDFWFVYDVDR